MEKKISVCEKKNLDRNSWRCFKLLTFSIFESIKKSLLIKINIIDHFFFIWSEYLHSFKNDSTLMFKRFFSFHHTTSCINWVIIRPHHADIKKIAKFSNFSLISHRLVVWKKQKMKIVFACKVFRNKTMNAMHNNFLDKCTIKREADFESLDLIV